MLALFVAMIFGAGVTFGVMKTNEINKELKAKEVKQETTSK